MCSSASSEWPFFVRQESKKDKLFITLQRTTPNQGEWFRPCFGDILSVIGWLAIIDQPNSPFIFWFISGFLQRYGLLICCKETNSKRGQYSIFLSLGIIEILTTRFSICFYLHICFVFLERCEARDSKQKGEASIQNIRKMVFQSIGLVWRHRMRFVQAEHKLRELTMLYLTPSFYRI